MLKPMDDIYDTFLQDPERRVLYSNDYPSTLPNTGSNFGMNTHFVIMKPDPELYTVMVDAVKQSKYDPTTGWNGLGVKEFKGVLGVKGFLTHHFTKVDPSKASVLNRCAYGNDNSNPYGLDAVGNPICRDPIDCQDCRIVDLKSVSVLKMIHTCGKPWTCSYDERWDPMTKTMCEGFHRAWFSARIDFETSCWHNGPPSFRTGQFHPNVFMGFCDCSGVTCYDRMIDDKTSPQTCDKDTQTNNVTGKLNFGNGGYQDQRLSLTTGQVTGSTTLCASGKIGIDGYDPPLNLGIVIDVSGSTKGAFGGTPVGKFFLCQRLLNVSL